MSLLGGLVLGLALTLGGSVGALAASPSPAATAIPADRVLSEALARLDALDSFRFTTSTTVDYAPDTVFGTAGLIVREPSPAWQVAMLTDGEPTVIQIVDGEDGWFSYAGSTFQSMTDLQGTVPEEPSMLFDVLERWGEQRIPLAQVGADTIDGRDVLHYRGRTEQLEISPDPDGYYRPSLAGSMELWVDAERGHLVQAVGDLLDVAYTFGNHARPIARHVEVRISDVDDPDNHVTPPGPQVPLPSAVPGDPALAALVRASLARLGDLDSYRVATRSVATEYVAESETLVINQPVKAARAILRVNGDEFIAYQDIDGVTATREREDAPWVETPLLKMPTCEGVPCGYETAIVPMTLSRIDTGSFGLVGEERLDGIAVTHLRSDAPLRLEGGVDVPMTTDVWIATDGGHLAKVVSDGIGITSELVVSAVNDPANVIEPAIGPAPSVAP